MSRGKSDLALKVQSKCGNRKKKKTSMDFNGRGLSLISGVKERLYSHMDKMWAWRME